MYQAILLTLKNTLKGSSYIMLSTKKGYKKLVNKNESEEEMKYQ